MTTTTRMRGLVLGVLLASCAALPTAAQASTPALTTATTCIDPTTAQTVDVAATGLAPNASYIPLLDLAEGSAGDVEVGFGPNLDTDANGVGSTTVQLDPGSYTGNGGDGATPVWLKLRSGADFSFTAELSIPICGADTTPPVLSLPADMTVDATSASGAAVTFTATATDDLDGAVPVSCDHASGSTFPVGTTTVTCSATDAAGNAASAAFNVVVRAQDDLPTLLARFGLHVNLPPRGSSTKSACNVLNAVVNEIQARTGRQPSKLLSPAQGDRLLAAARVFAVALGCR